VTELHHFHIKLEKTGRAKRPFSHNRRSPAQSAVNWRVGSRVCLRLNMGQRDLARSSCTNKWKSLKMLWYTFSSPFPAKMWWHAWPEHEINQEWWGQLSNNKVPAVPKLPHWYLCVDKQYSLFCTSFSSFWDYVPLRLKRAMDCNLCDLKMRNIKSCAYSWVKQQSNSYSKATA
jgi:hypothetical protein